MGKAEAIIKAIMYAASAAKTAVAARELYETLLVQASRDKELTPEEVADLRARADAEFASEASQQSGR